LWLTLESGRFEKVTTNAHVQTLNITFAPAQPRTPGTRLRIEHPAGDGSYWRNGNHAIVRGGWEFKLDERSSIIILTENE